MSTSNTVAVRGALAGLAIALMVPSVGSTADSIGLFDPTAKRMYLKDHTEGGAADRVAALPPTIAGQQAVNGDWDGDGRDTPGLYFAARGRFTLSNSLEKPKPDLAFAFGPKVAGLRAIAGDWDGDGFDTVAVYEPQTGTFWLNRDTGMAGALATFRFGPKAQGLVPLAGDWDGDGRDSVGLYDRVRGTFYLIQENKPGTADVAFRFGPAGVAWLPVAGDWNEDGVDTVGLYDPSASRFSLRNENTPGKADAVFPFGPANRGWLPIDGAWSPRKLAASFGDQELGLVLIEAEDFHAHDARQGLRWQTVATAGHSGRSAMQIVPGNRPKVETVTDGLVARLDYRILVTKPGRYYFRIRGMALGGGSNSIHVGLDGVVPDSGSNVQFGVGAGWTWSASTRYLDVAKPGAHIVSVWMREAGTVVDTIALFPGKATSAAELESLVQAGMQPVIPLPPKLPGPPPTPKQPPVAKPPIDKNPGPVGPGPSATNLVALTWKANAAPVSGYRVYFGLSPQATLIQLADFSTNTPNFPAAAPKAEFRAHEDLGLKAGEQACFRLRAYDATGVSGFSRAVCVKI